MFLCTYRIDLVIEDPSQKLYFLKQVSIKSSLVIDSCIGILVVQDFQVIYHHWYLQNFELRFSRNYKLDFPI